MANGRTLVRSRDKMIAGVCAGIAEYFGWDITLFRVVFVLASILSVAFPGILVYIVFWVVMPPPAVGALQRPTEM
jgi:phage shock protein PspC (stress-responsive transcriptional regulator)